MKLRNFVLTSNRYSVLLEGYMELFSKYWPVSEIKTTILGFDKPEVKLLDSFDFHSMGDQSDGRKWAEPLIQYFESIDDEYFLMCFEDHYVVQPLGEAGKARLCEGIDYIVKDNFADKLYLMPDYRRAAEYHYKGNWFISHDRPGALVTTSLLPAVWRRGFLLKLLKRVYETQSRHADSGPHAAHEFEGINNQMPTGGNTLLTFDLTLYANLDAVRRGEFNRMLLTDYKKKQPAGTKPWPWLRSVTEDVVEVFRRMAEKWEPTTDNGKRTDSSKSTSPENGGASASKSEQPTG